MSSLTSNAMTNAAASASGTARRLSVLYPNLYAWYILAATLDVVVTHTILHHLGGIEINKIADALIHRFGVVGMVGLKYSSIILVVTICEIVGRRNLRMGRRLAIVAIVLSALPVGIGLLKVWQWSSHPTPIVEINGLGGDEFTSDPPPLMWHRPGVRPAPRPAVVETNANGSVLASW